MSDQRPSERFYWRTEDASRTSTVKTLEQIRDGAPDPEDRAAAADALAALGGPRLLRLVEDDSQD